MCFSTDKEASMKAKISKNAFTIFNSTKKRMLDIIDHNQKSLTAELKAAIPENLAKWNEEGGYSTIKNLIECGHSSGKYYNNIEDKINYGFTSLKEFGKRLRSLQKAWNNTVKISICQEKHRIEVSFNVIK